MILAPQLLPRHVLMDVGRGFAILGILWFNIFLFALPFEAMVIPGIWGEQNTANIATWDFVTIGVSGVMRGMISMLFGAAAFLMLYRSENAENGFVQLDRYFRRLLILILFGVVHSYILLWPYDILYAYGVIGLFLFPFRNMSAKRLVVLACVMLAASTFFTAHNSNEVQKAQTAVEDALTEEEIEKLRKEEPLLEELDESSGGFPLNQRGPNIVHNASFQSLPSASAPEEETSAQKQFNEMAERIGLEIEIRQMGYITSFFALSSLTFDEQTDEMLTNHFLDIATFFLIGLVLLKIGFFSMQLHTHIYAKIACLGYLIGLTLGLLTSLDFNEGDFFEPVSALISTYSYDVRRLAFALANFALMALLLRFGVAKFVTDSLEACGRMALSLYILQTIICNFIFIGLGLFGQMEHHQIAVLAIVITLFQVVLARLYMRANRQGPLEWLLRELIGKTEGLVTKKGERLPG